MRGWFPSQGNDGIYIYINSWWWEDSPPKWPLTQNDCTWHDVIINSLGISNRTWSPLVHVIACCLFCAKSLPDSYIVNGTFINYILSNKVTSQLFSFNNIILIINCSYLMMSPIGQWVNMWTIENYWRCKMHLGQYCWWRCPGDKSSGRQHQQDWINIYFFQISFITNVCF